MALKERIIEMLKAGVSPTHVAEAVGCDISYVSQIKSDPETAAAIADAQLGSIEEDITHDELLASAELKALRAIEQRLGCLLYTSPSPRDLSTSRMPSSA